MMNTSESREGDTMASPLATFVLAKTAVCWKAACVDVGLIEPPFHMPLGERGYLALTSLGMIAENHGGAVGPEHVALVALMWADDDGDYEALFRYLLNSLTGA